MTTVAAEIAGFRAWAEERSLEMLARHVVRDAWADAMASLDGVIERLGRREADRVTRAAQRGQVERAEARARHFRLVHAAPPVEMEVAPVAPARGPMRLVDAVEASPDLAQDDRGVWQVDAVVTGQRWEGQCRLQVMNDQARAAHAKRGDNEAFIPPFSPGQVAMARRYAMLTERHAAGGMKCSSVEARTDGGGGDGGGFMDAFVAEGRELDRIHARIGAGQAMVVRRVRPSARGTRLGIADRRLVDMVCLGGMDLTAVLEAHGWQTETKHRLVLKDALAAALDRMTGYSDRGSNKGD
ncbi:hypothetical protein [Falsirhodobacter halotolerans]|uniref:hypothetical protein n=1 Tax=Falsirhodobacter halotolerans TaxID=1146892 RepID=UPI001FD46A95|nr:hypothetical protein [Falsirhodobacter halotolerans]MCJ8139502.1 hypothetical protein [Falsirhodobacter halotolerans]